MSVVPGGLGGLPPGSVSAIPGDSLRIWPRCASAMPYDNALAESVIGLYKTELIKPCGPWRTPEQVEVATLHYVDWFNRQRLFEACGDIPPAELEAAYYRQNASLAEAG